MTHINVTIKTWIEKDLREQRELGRRACVAYVKTPFPINGTCTSLPKAFDCVKSTTMVPRDVLDNLLQSVQDFSQSLVGFAGNCDTNIFVGLVKPTLKGSHHLPKTLDELAGYRGTLEMTYPSFFEVFNPAPTSTWMDVNQEWMVDNQDLFLVTFETASGVKLDVVRDLVSKYEFNPTPLSCLMLLPGTKLSFVACSTQKTKSNKLVRVFTWEATSPPNTEARTDKPDKLKLFKALNHYNFRGNSILYFNTLASVHKRVCTLEEAQTYTNKFPKSLATTHVQVESMRAIARPRHMTVFRGTNLVYPLVSALARDITLRDMQAQHHLTLDHLLSTSTSKKIAESFGDSYLEDVSFKECRTKAFCLHVFELQDVYAVDVKDVHDTLVRTSRANLPYEMLHQHEFVVVPGREVWFQLVKAEYSDRKVHYLGKNIVDVGDYVPNPAQFVDRLVERKRSNAPKKRKSHQMCDKTAELMTTSESFDATFPSKKDASSKRHECDFYPTGLEKFDTDPAKQSTIKNGNVVLYWKVTRCRAEGVDTKVLRGLHEKDTAFPSWACIKELNLDFRATRVFYDAKDKLVDVKRLSLEREPCNIQSTKRFDQAKLQSEFGYSESYYTRWARQHANRLPPNIAVYVKTHVYMRQVAKLVQQPSLLSWFHAKKPSCLFKRVHLISLVGLAFDHPSQPDFKHFGEAPSIDELLEAYTCIWRKAFECATYWDLPTIVATQVGNGAFKPPNLSYQEFKLGVHDKVLFNLKKAYPDIKVVQPRNVFGVIYKLDQAKLDNLLFVTSWDPHSMLGNGNCIDDSLDGKFGRCSAIAVLGWPGTNLHVRYKQI